MDPNATLQEIRRLINRQFDESQPELYVMDTTRLCELVEALDGWLSKGGFLPEEWQKWRQG